MNKNAEMHYAEFDVPECLGRYLQCVWRLQDPDPTGNSETIYPDGRCELMVHLASPLAMFELDRGWRQQQSILFAGQLTTAIRLAGRGRVDCIGIRLRPAASACAVDGPVARFHDQVVDLTLIDDAFARRFAGAARSFAADANHSGLWDELADRLSSHPIDPRIESAVDQLESDQGQTRIERLAKNQSMSLRSFQSRFLASVGLGAKQFARVTRLQATLRALDQGTQGLADLAVAAGYSDQAHATRELARLTGSTPAKLRTALSDDRETDGAIQLAAAFVRGPGR